MVHRELLGLLERRVVMGLQEHQERLVCLVVLAHQELQVPMEL
jgi:hypothetical protein